MDILYIVMPAYNEEANIEETVKAWYPNLEGKHKDSRLVIADSGSSDLTHEILLRLQKDYPKLEILDKTGKLHGPKVFALYDYAIKKGADYIFQTDSDGQTLAEEFPEFWCRRKEAAMVIGHRNHRQDGFSRIIVTKVLKAVIGVMFHVNVTDANTPYRLIQADVLKEQMHLIPRDYNLSNVLVSVIFVKKKLGVLFLPITFRPRQGGVNSINVRKIFKLGWKALADFRRLSKEI